jgi:hypothetical protein
MDPQYKGKSLEQMNIEEVFEFEKELLKKTIAARSMSESIQTQINNYINLLRMRKQELLEREKMGLDDPDWEEGEGLIIGEPKPEQPNDT